MRKVEMRKLSFCLAVFFLFSMFSGCSAKNDVSKYGSIGGSTDNRTVIWTSSAEFTQYIELFNRTHPDNNVVIVYKENPADCLPPARDETNPDIVVGPYLRSDKTSKYFKSLDYLFDRQIISTDDFYPQLIEAGKVHKTQYLLPVSFNLPVIIFDSQYKDLITNNYTLSL